jgi:hypothetical protein
VADVCEKGALCFAGRLGFYRSALQFFRSLGNEPFQIIGKSAQIIVRIPQFTTFFFKQRLCLFTRCARRSRRSKLGTELMHYDEA